MSYSLQFEYCSHILYCLMTWLLFSNLFPSRAKIVFLASCTGFFFFFFTSLDTSQAVNSTTILVGLRFYSSSSQASRAQSFAERRRVSLQAYLRLELGLNVRVWKRWKHVQIARPGSRFPGLM